MTPPSYAHAGELQDAEDRSVRTLYDQGRTVGGQMTTAIGGKVQCGWDTEPPIDRRRG